MNERTARQPRPTREQYRRFIAITTRWADNDVYGHINNVAYYAFFDTAVNQLLIEARLLDPGASDRIGMAVESRCTYHASVAYPDTIDVGVRVDHIGSSSVRYGLAVFRQGEVQGVATGEFTHVYVERATQRPIAIWSDLRAYLEDLRVV